MNETLYIWTFKFHKIVGQQNSGAVEDFILPYSAVYLRIQRWKNYWNWSTFAEVTVKIKVAQFFWLTVYKYVWLYTIQPQSNLEQVKDLHRCTRIRWASPAQVAWETTHIKNLHSLLCQTSNPCNRLTVINLTLIAIKSAIDTDFWLFYDSLPRNYWINWHNSSEMSAA